MAFTLPKRLISPPPPSFFISLLLGTAELNKANLALLISSGIPKRRSDPNTRDAMLYKKPRRQFKVQKILQGQRLHNY